MLYKFKYFFKRPLQLPIVLITKLIPYFSFLYQTTDYQNRITFNFWFKQKVLNCGGNKNVYWPVHFTSKVHDPENILVGIDAYPGISGGCYITGKGGIEIGDYTQIAPNVIIVSANHDIYDSRKSICAPVKIGKYCWIGAGAKIMPGVNIGDWTIVAAGAVVTKSFTEGHCIIAGVPAIKIKELDKTKCIVFTNKILYNGYIKSNVFEAFRKRNMKI